METTITKEQAIADIQKMMKLISTSLSNNSHYAQQRTIIRKHFTTEVKYPDNILSIISRLTIIDSLYSTNAQRLYFTINDLAEKINILGCDADAAKYFNELLNEKDDSNKLFSNKYGIHKYDYHDDKQNQGNKQISLISKYAYYILLQDKKNYPLGFPIYDSLARNMMPKVGGLLKMTNKETLAPKNTKTFKKYLKGVDILRQEIFTETNLFEEYQQYDILDAYLWRMGKLDTGNYSLLFNKNNYKTFIKNLDININEIKEKQKEQKKFKKEQKDEKDKIKANKESYEFNEIVKKKCIEKDVSEILKDINDDLIKEMIVHWKKYYVSHNK